MLRLRVAMKYFLKIKDFLTFGSKPSEKPIGMETVALTNKPTAGPRDD